MLWQDTEENWKSILSGLKKTKLRFLIATALLVYPKQPWLACNLIVIGFISCLMTFFIFIGAMSLYYARHDLLAFVEIAHAYSIMLAIWILLAVHFIFKMPSQHELFQMLDAEIFLYKTVYNKKKEEELKENVKLYAYIFAYALRVVLIIAVIILAILAPILINMYGDDDRKIIKEINYDFPVPFWFPFDTNTHLGFTVAYFLIMLEIFVIFFYVAATIPYLVYMALEINAQYKILGLSVLNLEERALERYNWTKSGTNLPIEMLRGDPSYERCIRESLKENIQHHIEILRFFDLYQDITSTLYGAIIGVSMMILASLSLVLTETKLLSFETMKFSFLFITELVIVFGYCLMGSSLTNGSEEIESSIYNCPWYNLSESQRRTLRIFQINSSMNIELKGNGLFVINLELFVQIVQTTYSIFNIFSTMDT